MSILSIPPFPMIRGDLTQLSAQLKRMEERFLKHTNAAARITYAIGHIDDLIHLITPQQNSLAIDLELQNLFVAFRRLEYYLLCSSETISACAGHLRGHLLTLQGRVVANITRIKSLYTTGSLEKSSDFHFIFKKFKTQLQHHAPEELRSTAPVKRRSIFCCVKKLSPQELNYVDVDQDSANAQVQSLLRLNDSATFREVYQQVCRCLDLFEITPKTTDMFVHLLLALYINLINFLANNPALMQSDYKAIINSRETSHLQTLVLQELESKGNFSIQRCLCDACGKQQSNYAALCSDCNSGICSPCYTNKYKYCHICSTRRLQWVPFELLPWVEPTHPRHTILQYNEREVEVTNSTTRLNVPTHGTLSREELLKNEACYAVIQADRPDSEKTTQAWGAAGGSTLTHDKQIAGASAASGKGNSMTHYNNPFWDSASSGWEK